MRVELLGPNTNNQRYLSLAEVEVYERVIIGYGELIGTDVEASMLRRNASAYIRLPFEVAGPRAMEVLKLRVKYDDGYVAYLNGREVARRNAPAVLAWNSAATRERPDSEAVVFEEINVSARLDALEGGANVLAIHGLNVSAGDSDFLILPELESSSVLGGELRFFPEPTPGAANETPGYLGFVADTGFSPDRGFYDTPFAVAITSETPGAEIRYTTDGRAPTERTGRLYRGPVDVDTTTTLRAATMVWLGSISRFTVILLLAACLSRLLYTARPFRAHLFHLKLEALAMCGVLLFLGGACDKDHDHHRHLEREFQVGILDAGDLKATGTVNSAPVQIIGLPEGGLLGTRYVVGSQ